MNQRINPNLIAVTLALFTLLVLGVAGISLQDNKTVRETISTPPDVEYTLKTGASDDLPMVFIGIGGEIDGIANPTLKAQVGQTVKITLLNEQGIMHDFTLEVFDVTTGALVEAYDRGSVTFKANKAGEFKYICSVPGHAQVGMTGTLIIEAGA